MKKLLVTIGVVIILMVAPVPGTRAQVPVIDIIKAAVIKAIKAADLAVQRLQNKTIWLQNAQKTLENTMSKLKLDQISDWVEKQKELYRDYYEELAKVKAIISYYQRIKEISQKQLHLLSEYKSAWSLFQRDKHFNGDELEYMATVYSGILDQSAKNMDEILLVVSSFKTQMTDAKRLELINSAANRVDENYYDLIRFNKQNMMLSLQRSKAQHEVDAVKKLYGLK